MAEPQLDDSIKTYFAKYSTEAEPSEHFPLMELPAYDCQEKLQTAEVFYQSEKDYTDEDGVQLGRAIYVLKPASLRQIYLTKNAISDAGAISIAKGIKLLERMDTLHLAENHIGDAGVVALSDAMKGLGLTTIVLTRNPFSDVGAEAIASGLADPEHYERLEWLFLNETKIADRGVAALGKALLTGAKELNRLALHDNQIGDEGAQALASCINQGAGAQNLEFLYFQNNPLSDLGKQAMFNACRGKIRCHLGWPPPLGGLNPEDWDV
eukprot:CAMPEP_0115854698 /NCGR_PEP_ID=MMETSP0287-20121206/14160_1 /TAXON_ID=412157 /ORGANISM="Chrysochromulina rotalis, Strain UIO044" /LENGTH=266 /DNA_ID=CAMNT_0003308827 /DNA_START=68 /DNA_END=868 /DNA_ORIENTATION=+